MDKLIEAASDDKSQVILALFCLGVLSFFCIDEPVQIIDNVVSGLLGLAIGRSK